MRSYNVKPRNATSRIAVTFDDHNLPRVRLENVSEEQLQSAGLFLQNISRDYVMPTPRRSRRKRHSLRKAFMRMLRAMTQAFTDHSKFVKETSLAVYKGTRRSSIVDQ